MTEDELQDFRNTPAEFGLRESDFSISETDTTATSPAIFAQTGTVRITYIPSGVVREYVTGHTSKWTARFHDDVQKGLYRKTSS
jgi:hypothetical protein